MNRGGLDFVMEMLEWLLRWGKKLVVGIIKLGQKQNRH